MLKQAKERKLTDSKEDCTVKNHSRKKYLKELNIEPKKFLDEKEKLFKAALKYIETPPSRNEKMATILHKQGLKVLPDEKIQKPNRTIPPR